MTKTNVAKQLERMALRLHRDGRGFVVSNYSPLLNLIRREAVDRRYPLGADSLDPTVEYVYLDGSVLRVDNPSQEVFPLRISEKIIF